jgi:hypothetical protein
VWARFIGACYATTDIVPHIATPKGHVVERRSRPVGACVRLRTDTSMPRPQSAWMPDRSRDADWRHAPGASSVARRSWEVFTMLHRIGHADSAQAIPLYEIEPYMIASVHAVAPHMSPCCLEDWPSFRIELSLARHALSV